MNDQVNSKDSIMTSCKSHYSADITGLYLRQNLLGLSHYFNYKDHIVEIRIPSPTETNKVRLAGRHLVDNEMVPSHYQVEKVDIYIEIPEALECINTQDENNVSPSHKIADCDPDELISEMTSTSIRAYRYWIDIVRLITKDYSIGLRSRRASSHDHASIVASSSEKRICSGPFTMFSKIVDDGIKIEVWDEIQSELNKGKALPLYYQFLIDANHALEDGRLKSCIIDLAMACETYLRFSVFEVLGECPEDVKSTMELANINSFTNGYFKNRVSYSHETKYKNLKKSDLNSLFSARNKLVHMGEMERVTSENCIRFINATSDLFSITLRDT